MYWKTRTSEQGSSHTRTAVNIYPPPAPSTAYLLTSLLLLYFPQIMAYHSPSVHQGQLYRWHGHPEGYAPEWTTWISVTTREVNLY